MSKLILVGTPIGNPHDMSIRAFNYIKKAKNIIAENPEDFYKLTSMLGLDKTDSNIMYAHTWPEYLGDKPLIPQVLELLKSGEDVYMISDTGMPAIADPGENIINACIKNGIEIISTPGPSAVITASAITGCGEDFYFGGFVPKDKEHRQTFMQQKYSNPMPNLFMLINDQTYVTEVLNDFIQKWGDRNGALCYNLTISKEHIFYGKLSELKKYYIENYGYNEVMIVIDGLSQTLCMPDGK